MSWLKFWFRRRFGLRIGTALAPLKYIRIKPKGKS